MVTQRKQGRVLAWGLTLILSLIAANTVSPVTAHAEANSREVRLGTYTAEKIALRNTIQVHRSDFSHIRIEAASHRFTVHEAWVIYAGGVAQRLMSLEGSYDASPWTQWREAYLEVGRLVENIQIVAVSPVVGARGEYHVGATLTYAPPLPPPPVPPTPPPYPPGYDEGRESTAYELFCHWNGRNFQPYNRVRGFAVGKMGFGYSMREACEMAISRSTNDLVCNWNGVNFQPYDQSRNTPVGKWDHGYAYAESCHQAVLGAKWRLVCQWNGRNYQPYNFERGFGVGVYDYGFSDLSSCLYAVDRATRWELCQWNGSSFAIYDWHTNSQRGGVGYRTLAECVSYLPY